MVNSLCSWIKRCLRRFPGMRPEHLQDYLDWCVYLFRVKRDDERWPKLERVLRRLVMTGDLPQVKGTVSSPVWSTGRLLI